MPFLDADGFPIKRRGVTSVKGLYVLGLDWLHTAKSGLFAGIGDDASYVASVITSRPLGGGIRGRRLEPGPLDSFDPLENRARLMLFESREVIWPSRINSA
jgi:hypothetical protein